MSASRSTASTDCDTARRRRRCRCWPTRTALVADPERLRQRLLQPLGDARRRRRASRSSPRARRTRRRRAARARRLAAAASAAAARNGDQESVADDVAEAVVDQLEAVEVDEQAPHSRPMACGSSARSRAAAARGRACGSGDPSTDRARGLLRQRVADAALLGDVGLRAGHADGVPASSRTAMPRHSTQRKVAVHVAQAVLDARSARARRQMRAEALAAARDDLLRAASFSHCSSVETLSSGDSPIISFQRARAVEGVGGMSQSQRPSFEPSRPAHTAVRIGARPRARRACRRAAAALLPCAAR